MDLPPIVANPDPSSSARSGRLKFHGRGADLFSKNGLLAVLCTITLVGAPFAMVLLWRWLAAKTETANGNRFTFRGSIGKAYLLIGTQIVLDLLLSFGAPLIAPHLGLVGKFGIFGFTLLARMAVDLTIYYFYIRYFIDNIEDAGGRRLHFTGDGISYVGFMLLIWVSFLTIIGWAWVYAAFYRWIFRHAQAEGVAIHFRAGGGAFLWRSLVYCLFCLPLVTIPWATAWFYRFLVTSVEIEHGPPPAAA